MKPTYEQLEAFYKEVASMTVNHDVLRVGGTDFDPDEHPAVVYPSKLGKALEKVDPEWYRNT